MNLDDVSTIEDADVLEVKLRVKKAEIATKLRPNDLITCKKIIALHGFTANELGIGTKKSVSKNYPVKYYDPQSGAYWSGVGSPKLAFKQAHREKRLDEYLISDEQGQAISMKIEKNVKLISGEIIEYKSL